MDVYEATRIVLSRIQSLDPANASKIMGLLLLQDNGEKEMIRLAFGPQNLVQSVIAKAKAELGLMSSSSLNPASLPFYAGRDFGDDYDLLPGPDLDSDLGLEWGHNVDERSRIELLRSKSVPPRLAHHFTGGSRFPYSPKGVSLQQSEAQRAAAAAALMMGDDLHNKLGGRWRPERIDLSAMACPASRQIYLTFPADSIFREEDVSNYFSTYGPVQDVRIPYQQKRMFGFVTFVYPETVKSILAKGNPHFVCDSRVLVKPYKEKGKVPDKYRTKPSPDDSMDLQLGGRAFHEDLLWRRRFEERALELQSRRLMNLQLLDVKKHFQLGFDQTHVSPRLDNSLSPLHVNQRVSVKENEKGSDEDAIKLPQSLEDRLPDSPFDESAGDTNGSDSSPPCFDNDESTTTNAMSESFKSSFNCQMPRLSMMGMLPGTDGQACRVGI